MFSRRERKGVVGYGQSTLYICLTTALPGIGEKAQWFQRVHPVLGVSREQVIEKAMVRKSQGRQQMDQVMSSVTFTICAFVLDETPRTQTLLIS